MYEFQLQKLQKMVSKGIKETFKTSEGHFRVSSTCYLGGQFDEGRTLHGFRINFDFKFKLGMVTHTCDPSNLRLSQEHFFCHEQTHLF